MNTPQLYLSHFRLVKKLNLFSYSNLFFIGNSSGISICRVFVASFGAHFLCAEHPMGAPVGRYRKEGNYEIQKNIDGNACGGYVPYVRGLL